MYLSSRSSVVVAGLLLCACPTPRPCDFPESLDFGLVEPGATAERFLTGGRAFVGFLPPPLFVEPRADGVWVVLRAAADSRLAGTAPMRSFECVRDIPFSVEVRALTPVVDTSSVDFGEVDLGTSVTRTIRVREERGRRLGSVPLRLAGPDASAFRVSEPVATAEGHLEVDVTFSPRRREVHRALLSVGSQELQLGLTGYGGLPDLQSACVSIPSTADLGHVEVGCGVSRGGVDLVNRCLHDVTASLQVEGPGFKLLAAAPHEPAPRRTEVQVVAGGSRRLNLQFNATSTGAAEGALRITLRMSSQERSAVVALRATGVPRRKVTDTYYLTANRSDVLVVVHPSAWLTANRSRVSTWLDTVVWSQLGVRDVRVAVVDDTPGSEQGRLRTALGSTVLATDDARFKEKLKALLEVSGDPPGGSRCLEATLQVLRDRGTRFPENAGFPRDETPLDVYCLSEKEDASPGEVSTLLAEVVTLSPAAKVSTMDTVTCDLGPVSARNRSIAWLGKGWTVAHCLPAWRLWPRFTSNTLVLNAPPDLVDGEIQVQLDGKPLPAVDERGSRVWEFSFESNALVLNRPFPDGARQVSVQYNAICGL